MAWTITETYDVVAIESKRASELVIIKLDCTSDANASAHDISEDMMRLIRGGYLYEMKVVPGAGGDAPTGAFDIDLEDIDDGHILDTDGNATDAITYHDGASTIGHYPVIERRLSFVSATLGDANTAVVYIKVLK